MALMKAVRIKEGAKAPSLETIEIPTIGPREVLIRVKAAGLQTGPVRLAQMGLLRPLPVTLGHEIAGEVYELGNEVENFQVGDRVRVHPALSCRSCDFCLTDRDQMCVQAGVMGFQSFGRSIPLFERYRHGGLAEFVRAPAWLVDNLSDSVSFEVASKVQDIATAYNCLKQAELRPGSTIIVTAPTGAMGVSVLKIAHFFGVGRAILVGRSAERLKAVLKLAKIRIDVVATENLSEEALEKGRLVGILRGLVPQGVDAIIDFLPSGRLISQMVHGLKCNGVLVHLGSNVAKLEIPLLLIMLNCWKVVGARNHSRQDAQTVLKWLSDGQLQVEELITHRWNFDQIDEALVQLEDRNEPMWMSVINPS